MSPTNDSDYTTGYQAAMTDLVKALETGNVEGALTWILDNAQGDTARTQAAVTQAYLDLARRSQAPVNVDQRLGTVDGGSTVIGYVGGL